MEIKENKPVNVATPEPLIVKVEAEGIKANMDKLLKFGYIEREVEPIPGIKLTMHSLTDEEHDQATLLVEDKKDLLSPDFVIGMNAMRKPMLAFAITKLNGVVIDTPEKRQMLHENLKKMVTAVVNMIYIEYQKIFLDQAELLQQGLKKT